MEVYPEQMDGILHIFGVLSIFQGIPPSTEK